MSNSGYVTFDCGEEWHEWPGVPVEFTLAALRQDLVELGPLPSAAMEIERLERIHLDEWVNADASDGAGIEPASCRSPSEAGRPRLTANDTPSGGDATTTADR